MNIFHKYAEFVAKHKGHHHLALASLALVLAGTSAYIYRQEIAQAATYTFTQSSWAGGVTANTAVHPTNQTSWAQYSAISADTIADANGVRLGTVSYFFADDGATSTDSPIATGGGFGSGSNSSTAVSGSGSGASVGLSISTVALAEINNGAAHTCAIKTDGTVYCWGIGTSGQRGDGTTTSTTTPVQVLGVGGSGVLTDVAQISAGGSTSCAIKTDGTVYCWGLGSNGQRGDGTYTASKTTPVQVLGVGGSGVLTDVAQVKVGELHTCAVKTDGSAYCWGYGNYGGLGDGNSDTIDGYAKNTPVQVLGVGGVGFLTNVQQISAERYYSCAVKTDSTVYCWGEGGNGQRGDGSTALVQSTPVQVLGVGGSGVLTDVANVSVGPYNTACAIKTDGTVYCWGSPLNGALGDNVSIQTSTPVQVVGVGGSGVLTDVARLGTGYARACAVKTDGTAYCWGNGSSGARGDGSTTASRITPVQVLGVGGSGVLTNVSNIDSGSGTSANHTCAVKTDGTAYCWGLGTSGQRGDGTLTSTTTPVQVRGVGGSGYFNLITYSTPGTFTSAVIDTGAQSVFTTASYTTTLNGQTITVDARAGNTATPDGSWSAWQTGIASGGSISGLSGNRYFQYRANLSTSDTALTPTLDSLTINYSQYASSGDLTSSKYDVGSESVISRLSWTASTSTTETVRFQVQSSPDNSTWSGWCGFSDTGPTCDGSNYFTDAHNGVTLGTSHPLRSTTNGGLADRYFQYKVFLVSGGAVTPELTSVTVQYVLNAPPLAGNVIVSQIIDPLDANYGKVSFSFDVSDEDTSSGSPENQYKLTPTLYQYSTDGVSFSTISSGLGANAYSVINLSGDSATTTTSVLWTPPSDIALTSNAKIRVTVTDGEAANFSATATSGTFSLDTTAPVVASTGGFLVDSSIGGSGLAGIKLFATDASTMQYRLCNNADFSDDGLNSGAGACGEWSSASSAVDLTTSANSWNTVLGADSTEKVYMQVRDLYGNVTSRTASAPAMPPSFIATDTTNLNSDTYREFLSWGKASSTTFGSYKVYYNTTGAGSSYSLLGTVTDVNENYYTHTITTATSSTHYYKMVVLSANGDISEFTSIKSDVPDGSGSTDVTAPYIPYDGIAVSSVRNTSANITFSTYTDVSLAEGELATSTVRYASYTDTPPTSCPNTSSTNSNTYVVNHSVYLTGLTPSTNYAFCVLAKDISGNVSTASYLAESGGTFTTIGGPRITGVTQREVTDTSATIFWNTDRSSDSKVYFSTSAGGVNGATPVSGAVVTTSGTNENGTFYQHQIGLTALTPGLTYYYKVSSADATDPELVAIDDNTGQYYSFVTLKDTTPPTIMGTSTPVLAPDSAVIVWQTNELASTKVEYGLTDSYGTISEDVSDPLSIYHVRALTALTKETLYYYRVTSKDAANNSATATGTFTTPADGNVTITVVRVTQTSEGTPPDTTAPAISNVKVTDITPFGATVSFDTNEDAVSFVEYGKSVTYGDSAGSKAWSKTHSIKLRGLTLGTEYFIKVSAVDKAGNTGTGGEQTFKTTFLSENLKDMANVENIEQFQKEIESAIESILPSLVPPFITKPVISEITESTAKISFRTNIKAFPVVVFAEDGVFDETKENPYTGEMSDTTEKATSHEIALTGLKGNTKYHIQARGFSLPRVIGKSADVTFITKASKIAGSIVERKKDSFTVVWTTEEPTSSIVEFKDLKRGITGRKTDDAKKKSHSMKIENLPSGTAYEVNLSGVTEQGNVAEAGSPISVTTSTDVTAPVISGFKVDNALVPGRTDRIQTIVTWVTDEPSDSTVYYQEGAGSPGDTEELANKNEVLDSYITNHSVILPSLKPGTIYRLKVTSRDDSGNLGSFGPRTVITPKQTESITDIIFKNFEDSFKFLRKI